jgi:hypothetical protein
MKIYSIRRSLIVAELKIVAQPQRQRSHWSTVDSGLSDGLMEPSHLDFMQKNRGPLRKPCNWSISSMTWRDVVESLMSSEVRRVRQMTLRSSAPRTPKMASHIHALAIISAKSSSPPSTTSQPPPRKILFSPTAPRRQHMYDFTKIDIAFLHVTS